MAKSIREIAKITGLSTATVSRYINNTGNVSAKSSVKIKAVLDEYEYVPSNLTSAIMKGRTNDIGLMVQNILNPFFAELVNEIEQQAQKCGYNLLICNTNGNRDVEEKYYKEFVAKRVSGILVMNTRDEAIYAKSTIPIIGLEKRINNGPKIITDNKQAISLLAKQINQVKIQNILFIMGPIDNYSSQARRDLFCQTYDEKNIDVISVINELENQSLQTIDFSKYDLVMCWNDLVAHGAYKEIIKQQLKIPQDLELIGFDGLQINKVFSYQLTTLVQDYHQLGALAIKMIDDLLSNKPVTDVYVQTKLFKGDTTNNI